MAGRLMEILAGAELVFGLYPEICALALTAFMIPASLIAHSFWLESGQVFQLQLVNFLKNLAMNRRFAVHCIRQFTLQD
jgi:uncharacterized membrane protein YphA (DoxX/SURF4 family)